MLVKQNPKVYSRRVKRPYTLAIRLSRTEFARIKRAALAADCTPSGWARERLEGALHGGSPPQSATAPAEVGAATKEGDVCAPPSP